MVGTVTPMQMRSLKATFKPTPSCPFSGGKLSVVPTAYRVADFDDAVERVIGFWIIKGAATLAASIRTIWGTPRDWPSASRWRACSSTKRIPSEGGSFDNGRNFTLSMGCGTGGQNSISENLNHTHFLNTTHWSSSFQRTDRAKKTCLAPIGPAMAADRAA